jgi:hypothetical protein
LEISATNEDHIASKYHRKVKTQYLLTSTDDVNCILEFKSSDALSKLKAERLNTLKKRFKKIKQRMLVKALKHETICQMGKDASSVNKQRLQKLCLDLDKQVNPQIKDYDLVDNTLKDIIKVLDNQREADLHIMRQLKFIPILMEICKRTTVCHKNEINSLLRLLDTVIKIITKFAGLLDNRTYMLLTNRLVSLVDLLIWCLNRPTKFVYSLGFVPHLFNILLSHLKHRLSSEHIPYREDLIEYIFCSGFIIKLQQKFMSFNGGLDLSTSMGKVPLALLKSVGFLEVLSGSIDMEKNMCRYIFDKPLVSENIVLVFQETECVGMVSLLASLLLSDGAYSKTPTKVLPQTVVSLAMTSIKFFNNVARLDLQLIQKLMGSKIMNDQVFHVFNYLLTYCNENYDNSEDVKDLLNELILLLGYFSVLNPANQDILTRGTPTLVQKLTGLPVPYFTDKRLKDILYPTMLCASYNHTRNLEIINQDMSMDHLEKYLQYHIQLYPFEQIQEEGKETSVCGDTKFMTTEKDFVKIKRPLSASSNNSSTTSLFATKSSMSGHFQLNRRFPRHLWESLRACLQSKM